MIEVEVLVNLLLDGNAGMAVLASPEAGEQTRTIETQASRVALGGRLEFGEPELWIDLVELDGAEGTSADLDTDARRAKFRRHRLVRLGDDLIVRGAVDMRNID